MKVLVKDYLEEYCHIPLFSGIDKNDLIPMLECLGSFIKTYKKGDFILMADQVVSYVGVLIAGSVQMVKEDLWGNKTILAIMNKTELFGETFTCGHTLIATVSFVANMDSKVLYIPFEHVMHTCSNSCNYHHLLIENMVTLIANKNVQLMEKLEIVSKKSLREKITTFLSIQAQKNNSNKFVIPMNRVELAEYLCADRSALSRELNNMRVEGLIAFQKNSFQIL